MKTNLSLVPQVLEPILTENKNRFVLFPIQHHNLWKLYKTAEAAFWTAEEIDLTADLRDWNNMTDNERHFVKHHLAFFAFSDGIVNENLAGRFFSEVQLPEARCFYGFQMMIENIHGEFYSQLIDTYITNTAEKDHLFNALETVPAVRKKAEWALKWINNSDSFAERLVAFACVEGIFFSAAFCAIFWLKKRGLVPGLAAGNELISRDEGMHTDFACELYKMLEHPLSQDRIYEIVDGAIEIEKEFITKALPVSLIGMNSDAMLDYIKFCADRLIRDLGYKSLYKTKNPFEWMNVIGSSTKGNFFEVRSTAYQKVGVASTDEDDMFDFS